VIVVVPGASACTSNIAELLTVICDGTLATDGFELVTVTRNGVGSGPLTVALNCAVRPATMSSVEGLSDIVGAGLYVNASGRLAKLPSGLVMLTPHAPEGTPMND